MSHYIRDGIEQVGGDIVSPFGHDWLVAGFNQDCFDTGIGPRHDVAFSVADEICVIRVAVELAKCLQYKFWLGFATIAVVLRCVRTNIGLQNRYTAWRKHRLDSVVDSLKIGLGDAAFSDARLIGYENYGIAIVGKVMEGFNGVWE